MRIGISLAYHQIINTPCHSAASLMNYNSYSNLEARLLFSVRLIYYVLLLMICIWLVMWRAVFQLPAVAPNNITNNKNKIQRKNIGGGGDSRIMHMCVCVCVYSSSNPRYLVTARSASKSIWFIFKIFAIKPHSNGWILFYCADQRFTACHVYVYVMR